MKKKLKRVLNLTIAVLLIFTMLVGCSNNKSTDIPNDEKKTDSPNEEEKVESKEEFVLTYSDSDPPGGMRTAFVQDVWLPEIVKQTDGRVKFNDFWGGALLEAPEALEGGSEGVADMTMVYPDFYPNRLFTYQIFRLFPEAPQDWENISWIFDTAISEIPQFTEEIENYNQKTLLVTLGLPAGMAATYPIDGIEDMIGKDWRASSRWHLDTFKHIGINPVSVPWNDIYMALQTGTIDGVLTNYDGLHMMKFHEAAPNVIVAPQLWWGTPFLHTINLDTWNSLPEDIQEGIIKATEIAEEKFADHFAGELEKTIQEEKDAGVTVKIADEDDVAYFTDPELLENIRNTWISEAESERNIENPESIINKMMEIIDEALSMEE